MNIWIEVEVKNANPDTDFHKKHLVEEFLKSKHALNDKNVIFKL